MLVSSLYDLLRFSTRYVCCPWRESCKAFISLSIGLWWPRYFHAAAAKGSCWGKQPYPALTHQGDSASPCCGGTNAMCWRTRLEFVWIKTAFAFRGEVGLPALFCWAVFQLDSFSDAAYGGEEGASSHKYFCGDKEGGSTSSRTGS